MANWGKISSRGSIQDRRSNRNMLALGGGGLSITGIALLFLFNYLSGGNITDVIPQIISQGGGVYQEDTTQYEGADDYEVFASTVLGSTSDVWSEIFAKNNSSYTPPQFVLFRGATESACGGASADIGPHYCPLDQTIYLDETFFDALQTRFGAGSADVAQAYVIAHEVGHHVQNETGALNEALEEAENSPHEAQSLSIAAELQADCYAGVWAYSLRDQNVFAPGEIQEAIDAAGAVGDDRIQQKTTGRITPETWTHGSSAARVAAFEQGYTTGTMESCAPTTL